MSTYLNIQSSDGKLSWIKIKICFLKDQAISPEFLFASFDDIWSSCDKDPELAGAVQENGWRYTVATWRRWQEKKLNANTDTDENKKLPSEMKEATPE